MQRPPLARWLFSARIALIAATSVLGIIMVFTQTSTETAFGDAATTRYPVSGAEVLDPATGRLAKMIDDLYLKVGKLEAPVEKSRALAAVLKRPWLLYVALFTPLLAALLQFFERRVEDRRRGAPPADGGAKLGSTVVACCGDHRRSHPNA